MYERSLVNVIKNQCIKRNRANKKTYVMRLREDMSGETVRNENEEKGNRCKRRKIKCRGMTRICMYLQAKGAIREDEETVETRLPAIKEPTGPLWRVGFLRLDPREDREGRAAVRLTTTAPTKGFGDSGSAKAEPPVRRREASRRASFCGL